jgi:hypothetical protein
VSGILSIARRPALVATLAVLACALAFVPARRIRVASDLATLLPDGSPAAADYRVFLERFGGLEKVFVLVLPDGAGGADEADLARAAGRLEEVLAASPEVASARAGIRAGDEEFLARYVAPRAPLLLDGDWRGAVARRLEPDAVRARVARLKAALSTPAAAAHSVLARSDPLGFSEELTALSGHAALPVHLLSSTFLAPGGDAALVILTPARSEMDPAGGRALLRELDAAYAAVQGEVGAPLVFRAVGGPLYAAQDEKAIREDLEWTLAGSLGGTTAILVAAFEGVLMPVIALVPLLVALWWTAAWTGLFHPEIAAVSVGFGAVLVGLGIDYGIHAGARFRQALASAADAWAALDATVRHSGPGILTSALTTAAGFAVLGLAHFRPLRELGQLVAVGILTILAAVALLGSPALVAAAPRLRRPGAVWRALGRGVDALTGLAARRARLVLAAAAGLTAVALWGLGALSIEADPRVLRPVDHPAREAETLLAERFDLGVETATVVVRGRDLPVTLARAGEAARLLRSALGAGAAVTSPADYLALGAPVEARLRELAGLPLGRAADDLERELRTANLNPAAFARGLDALRALGRGEDPGAPPPEAWPDWLAEALATDQDGTWAALSLRLPASSWPDGPPAALVAQVKAAVAGSAFASAVAIGTELRVLALRDLETLGLLALAAVAAVVVISLRFRWGLSLQAGLPVVLGALWTLGIWAALGQSLDLFSLAIMPVMLGIGIDDGLHVAHGVRREPGAGVAGAVRGAGRAMVLTTLTTCAGFGSLGLSQIPGLRRGGLLIAAGVAACLLATLLVLPALEAATRRKR